MPETRSLHRKLAQVMYEAERIPKNGTAPAAMGGFKFVQVGDAADAIRKALAEQKVSMIPTSIEVVDQTEHPSGADGKKVMTTMTVRTTWTLTDADSGESTVIQSLGSGGDTGDKAAPKAQSNAMKYALLMGFLLSTGDDPEMTDTSDRQRSPAATVYSSTNPPPPLDRPNTNGGLIGIATKQAQRTTDFELRQSPDGPFLGFRLKDGAGVGVICEVRGPLAEALVVVRAEVIDQRIQVWGQWVDYKPPVVEHAYRAFRVERIQTAEFILPAPEAPSVPLFSADELEGVA